MANTSIHRQAQKHSPGGPLVVRHQVYRALPLINRAVLKMMVADGDAVIVDEEKVPVAGHPGKEEHTGGATGGKRRSRRCSR